MGVTGKRLPDLDLAYFLAIPWCAALLRDPAYTPFANGSRQPKPSSSAETTFAETLNTKATIGAFQEFYKTPAASSGGGTSGRIEELCTLLSLGYGVNGHEGICHGGIVATMLDEVMGNILTRNAHLGNGEILLDHFTAYLNTTYVKPVRTPQVVLVKARVREVKGRKYYVEGVLVDKDGVVLAKGEALFVGVQPSRVKL